MYSLHRLETKSVLELFCGKTFLILLSYTLFQSQSKTGKRKSIIAHFRGNIFFHPGCLWPGFQLVVFGKNKNVFDVTDENKQKILFLWVQTKSLKQVNMHINCLQPSMCWLKAETAIFLRF